MKKTFNATELYLLTVMLSKVAFTDLKKLRTVSEIHKKIDDRIKTFMETDREARLNEKWRTEEFIDDKTGEKSMVVPAETNLDELNKDVFSYCKYDISLKKEDFELLKAIVVVFGLKCIYEDGQTGVKGRDDIDAYLSICDNFKIKDEEVTRERSLLERNTSEEDLVLKIIESYSQEAGEASDENEESAE